MATHVLGGGADIARGRTAASGTGGATTAGKAARGATFISAGALVIALTTAQAVAPPALAATAPTRFSAVALAAASSTMQPTINKLLAAQQQVGTTNSAYTFIGEFDKTTLPQYLNLLATTQLQSDLGVLNLDNSYDPMYFAPTSWNAPAADSFYLNAPSPDKQYVKYTTGQGTFTVTVYPASGSQDSDFRLEKADFSVPRAYDISQFTANADGSYTITVSPTPQPGNWIDSSGTESLLFSTAVGDWGLPHTTVSVKPQAPTPFKLPVLSDSQIETLLNNVATGLPGTNAIPLNHGIQSILGSLPSNKFTPIALSSPALGPVLPGQLSSFAHYSLAAGQAMIITVPDVPGAEYSSVQTVNAWAVNLPSATTQGSLNDTQVYHASGYTTYVVSSEDPGVANWIDTSGNIDGALAFRWQGADPSQIPSQAIQVQIVNTADVKANLPQGFPTVTPAQRAAETKQRLFEYDYARDQSYSAGWVTNNLEVDQIKAAIGTDQFNAIFGSQQDVPSLWDRMTDSALTPGVFDLARVAFTRPAQTFSAIVQNLPLAAQDIAMPVVLAALRLNLLTVKTIQSVQAHIQAGQWSEIPADLGRGLQGFATVVGQTFFDPATSITAGFLNARDDLAVSITNAGSYAPLTKTDLKSTGTRLSALNKSVADMLSGGFKSVLKAGADTSTTQQSSVASAAPTPVASKLSTTPSAAPTTAGDDAAKSKSSVSADAAPAGTGTGSGADGSGTTATDKTDATTTGTSNTGTAGTHGSRADTHREKAAGKSDKSGNSDSTTAHKAADGDAHKAGSRKHRRADS